MSYDLFNPPPQALVRERDTILTRVETAAGVEFNVRSREFIVGYLREHGPTPGEVITDECKKAGITPPKDDRSFGPQYKVLSRQGIIEKHGWCARRKGHLTGGGIVWRLKPNQP